MSWLGLNYCTKHNNSYQLSCRFCTCEQKKLKPENIWADLHAQALKERDKHLNETCSNCDKLLDFDSWFCYCSLCPDCYLKIPEEEIKQMDKQFKERFSIS